MQSYLRASLRTLLFVIAACALVSAQGTGLISGHVADPSGGVLVGAKVEIEPGNHSVATDAQGEFAVRDLQPGSYEVAVSYVGFINYSGKMDVVGGRAVRVDAVMKVASAGEEILVTAERPHAEAEAINRSRSSENILQVIPAEVIRSLPNVNIADALGRLPSVTLERDEGEGKYVQIRGTSPRLSNVTINGVNVPSPESGARQIKLDVIPSDLVESVEINKTLSPNQDGDAIGGSVNLRTKAAGDQPRLAFEGLGGYTPIIGGRYLNTFNGTAGDRFGKQKKLGVLFGGTYDYNGRGIDDLEPSPTTFNGVNTYNGTDLREYRYYRDRWGYGGTVDYKLGELSSIYVRGLYSHFDNFGDRWVYSPGINTFLTPTQGDVDGSVSANVQIRRPVQVIGSLAVGGKHTLDRWWMAWDLSLLRSGQTNVSGDPTAKFKGPQSVPFTVDTTDPLAPKLTPTDGINPYDPSLFSLKSYAVIGGHGAQLNLQASWSGARNYSWSGHSGTLEIGGKFRNGHKYNDASEQDFKSNDKPTLSQFLGTFSNSSYYGGKYRLPTPLADYGKIRSYFNANPGSFTLDVDSSHLNTDPNNFDLTEHIGAAYIMNTVDVGRWHVQGGVRFESTGTDLLGYQVLSSDGTYVSTSPLRQNASYLDVLPSVQARYRLTADSGLRLSFGRGSARPNFSDLPPTLQVDDIANTISVGNPNLKAEHAYNYDILYERYLRPLGLIQAGYFYKDISSPIYLVNTTVTANQYGGLYTGFNQSQPVNGGLAHVQGFEVAYQQRLSFLPGGLNGLGISANYSYTQSRATHVPGRTDNPALERQAPTTWNISPTYDKGRLSVRLGVSYNGANIFQYQFQDGADGGLKGPSGDIYLYKHTQVDLQGTYRLSHGLTAVVSGLNLNNEVFGFYAGNEHSVLQREFYKPSVIFGLRWSVFGDR